MPLSPESSHGGGTFNGGTITDALIVAPTTDVQALDVVGVAGGTAARFVVERDGENSYFQISGGGRVDIQPDTVADRPLDVYDGNGNLVFRIDSDGYVQVYGPFGGTGTIRLSVFANAGDEIFRVDDDGDLHGKTGKALTFDL